ncbi:hypothetical protein NDU88_002259 [Pleurodeles waltl]|uniref:Uncharacterized protein n=1 Tax=Pleurodeles waltl TaxID=8319 RepID=A0AAV7VAP7_PLEWA|nr:hypothetical protein NDU88_002259 [Pleurodeles waltl]
MGPHRTPPAAPTIPAAARGDGPPKARSLLFCLPAARTTTGSGGTSSATSAAKVWEHRSPAASGASAWARGSSEAGTTPPGAQAV